ncbi:MAG: hypothetical protein JNM28_01845 [Armatimonadetes bacterium]|nr:hypothetical protein [Armatimonadota bacterium]
MKIVIQAEADDSGIWTAWSDDMPGHMGQGVTRGEATRMVKRSINQAYAQLLKSTGVEAGSEVEPIVFVVRTLS